MFFATLRDPSRTKKVFFAALSGPSWTIERCPPRTKSQLLFATLRVPSRKKEVFLVPLRTVNAT